MVRAQREPRRAGRSAPRRHSLAAGLAENGSLDGGLFGHRTFHATSLGVLDFTGAGSWAGGEAEGASPAATLAATALATLAATALATLAASALTTSALSAAALAAAALAAFALAATALAAAGPGAAAATTFYIAAVFSARHWRQLLPLPVRCSEKRRRSQPAVLERCPCGAPFPQVFAGSLLVWLPLLQ